MDSWRYEDEISPIHQLSSLRSATEDEIYDILSKSPPKSCELDPIPTSLLKKCANAIVPIITKIINICMETGVVPDSFKVAHVRPLLKKLSLDHNILKNYRPVSNLNVLGKTLERVVMLRVSEFINQHHLYDNYQSAYRSSYSTESALLRVQNDVFQAMNHGHITLLVLLDLSAAFDTDHTVFLNRLRHRIGINGTALSWFKSYLTNRSQRVCINDSTSETVTLDYGLPQGSVIGPGGFSIYMLPLGV